MMLLYAFHIWLFSFLFTVSNTVTSTIPASVCKHRSDCVKDTPTVWWGGLCLCQRRWRWIWGRHEWTEASGSTCDSGTSETRLYWPDSGACWKPKQQKVNELKERTCLKVKPNWKYWHTHTHTNEKEPSCLWPATWTPCWSCFLLASSPGVPYTGTSCNTPKTVCGGV